METKVILKFDLQLDDSIKLIIYESVAKKIVLLPMLLMAVGIFLVPILGFAILTIIGDGIPFGFIITCVISWIVSSYIVSLYLWNKYGKELFIVQGKQFISYNDYHYFQDNRKRLHFKTIGVYMKKDEQLKRVTSHSKSKLLIDRNSIIAFKLDDKFIISKNELPVAAIKKIADFLIEN